MVGYGGSGGSALELLLGPDGEYIREIIIDELAKGIDAGWRSSLDSFIGSTRSRLLRAFRVRPAAGCPSTVTVSTFQGFLMLGMIAFQLLRLLGHTYRVVIMMLYCGKDAELPTPV